MNKIVAIDGPAGSGKGTLAANVSKACNLVNIDTGATYRCVALAALRKGLTIEEKEEITKVSSEIKIEFSLGGKVFLDGEDVTSLIRSKEVTQFVSPVSSIVSVRKNMVDLQRKMAENQDIIMEGRDITTVVFPNAQYKIYLDASLEERVNRRVKQNEEKGIEMNYDEVYESIKARDYNDMHKEVGSLMRTEEQIYIDSTNMTIEEVTNKVIKIVKGED